MLEIKIRETMRQTVSAVKNKGTDVLAPQIEYSVFFTRFNKAYLLRLYKINFLTRGSDKNRIASHSP